jgi:hypothetical protein
VPVYIMHSEGVKPLIMHNKGLTLPASQNDTSC